MDTYSNFLDSFSTKTRLSKISVCSIIEISRVDRRDANNPVEALADVASDDDVCRGCLHPAYLHRKLICNDVTCATQQIFTGMPVVKHAVYIILL